MRYSTGTITVTNGSHIVIGSGTVWSGSLPLFIAVVTVTNGITTYTDEVYEVSRVVSSTTLWLTELYRGTTKSLQTYVLSNSFTPLYNFPLTSKNDGKQATTISDFLIAAESKMVELQGSGNTVRRYRGQPYTTGTALPNEDSTTVLGFSTTWTALPDISVVTEVISGGEQNYFPHHYFAITYFPEAYWSTVGATSSGSVMGGERYIKWLGEYDVYGVESVDSDTTLTLSSAYSPENSITAYSDSSTYSPGEFVLFNDDIWVQKYNNTTTAIPPINDYDATTNYNYGNIVLSSDVRYTYIGSDTTSGHATSNSSYWRLSVLKDYTASFNPYWLYYRGSSYQIVSTVTENYILPIVITGTADRWAWFSKSLNLLDSALNSL